MASDPVCEKKEHKMHMCSLKAEGFDKKNPDKYKQLITNPKYECENCGSKAAKSENLCKPVQL